MRTYVRWSLTLTLCFVAATAAFAAGEAESAATERPTITVMMAEPGNVPVLPDAPAYETMMERTGIDVEFQPVPSSDYGAKISTLIATDNVPDVARIGYGQYYDFAASGVFLALDDYIESDVPNLRALLETHSWVNRLRVDGTLYAFPAISRDYDEVVKSPLMFMRTDLVRAQGLEVPSTFAELRTTLSALREAYPESLGWITRGSNALRSIAMYSLGSGSGLYYDPDVDGGSYVYAPATPEYMDAVSYLRDLYADGLIDPDYAVTSSQQWQEKGGSGLGLFSYDNPIFMDRMNRAMQSQNPDLAFEFIPVLATEDGMRRYQLYTVHPPVAFAVGRHIEDPQVAMRLFNWLYSEEGCDIRSLGIEGVHWEVADGEKRIKPELIEQYRAEGDPYSLIQSEIGIAYNTFTPYLDNTLLAQVQIPVLQEWWFDIVASDPARDYPVLDPPFTAAERERIKEIRSALSTLETEAFDKFVQGAWPMSRIDSVVSQLQANGYEELVELYNAANARAK